MTAFAGVTHCWLFVPQPIEVKALQPVPQFVTGIVPQFAPLVTTVYVVEHAPPAPNAKLEKAPKATSSNTNSLVYFPTLLYPLKNP